MTLKPAIIEMHLREMTQLFDSLDHSPFREKDLDRNAEEYIVDSIKELPARAACELVIHFDQPASTPNEVSIIEEALHVHFARRAQVLRRLLRRGWIRLGIGLSFTRPRSRPTHGPQPLATRRLYRDKTDQTIPISD